MSAARVLRLFRKDMAVGPRSPFFMFALVWPIVMTLLIRLVFGELFAPTPRLGIVDHGDSQVVDAAAEYPGIDVTHLDDRERLWAMVEANDLDAGWVVQADFDAALGRGDRPPMEAKVGGGSLASHRVILAIALADVLRAAAPTRTRVEVDVVSIGEGASLPLETRLMPLMVLFAVMLGGIFLTASSIVNEKVKGTLAAILVTPMSMREVLLGKGAFGFALAMLCGFVTLIINGVLGATLIPVLAVLALAALMMAEIGLILGALVNNTNTLFTIWKGGGWLLALPIMPYLWEAFPLWIAKLSPTYYFVQPTWRIVVENASLADVAPTLGVGLVVSALLVPIVLWTGRRTALAIGTSA